MCYVVKYPLPCLGIIPGLELELPSTPNSGIGIGIVTRIDVR